MVVELVCVLVEVVKCELKLCDIIMKELIENVVLLIMVIGGLINVVLYYFVIVYVVEVDWMIDDFECICKCVLVICDLKLFGKYVVIDLYWVGGIL